MLYQTWHHLQAMQSVQVGPRLPDLWSYMHSCSECLGECPGNALAQMPLCFCPGTIRSSYRCNAHRFYCKGSSMKGTVCLACRIVLGAGGNVHTYDNVDVDADAVAACRRSHCWSGTPSFWSEKQVDGHCQRLCCCWPAWAVCLYAQCDTIC